MKFRAAAAIVGAATLGMAGMPAHATPYAGQFQYAATGTIAVQGADGARWLLALTATASGSLESRPEQRLYLDLSRCVGNTCTTVGKWTRPLTAAEVTITSPTAGAVDTQEAKATLHALLGNARLDVDLTGSSVGGGSFNGVGSSTSPPGVGPGVTQYTYAGGSLTIGRITCAVTQAAGATIGRRTIADTVGDDVRDPRVAPPARLPAGFLTGPSRPRC